MPKRKRNSTWYRHCNNEVEQLENVLHEDCTNVLLDEGTSHSVPIPEGRSSVEAASNEYLTSSFAGSASHVLDNNSAGYSGCESMASDVLAENIIYNDPVSSELSDMSYQLSDSFQLSDNHSDHSLDANPNICSNNHRPSNNGVPTAVDKLRCWAISHRITHSALKDLLHILSDSREADFECLPKDPRTFLNTPKKVIARDVSPGEYCHLGIQSSLENQYKRLKLNPSGEIKIAINIDGLPLEKSTSSQVYPILGINKSIHCGMTSDNVFLIGIYHGYEKPHDFNDFLHDFIEEATKLTSDGIELFGNTYVFKITMYLFDAVAKASVLNIIGHAGYYSCTKCTQKGSYLNDRICFPDTNFTKRTHEDFINQTNSEHHHGQTLLLNIPNIDIVSDVPLDYMHLVLLGVVKKLTSGIWCMGRPPHKMSSYQLKCVSDDLISFRNYVPSEFLRRPRSLKSVKLWKATEFRQFLLYTGPVVLKNVLCKQKYQNFLTLTVAITILLDESFCISLIDYAESLLKYFVETVKSIYGTFILTHNFHNLLHLADDVRKFGPLENFSNFSSENFLQSLLHMIRKSEKPLQQIVRRYKEYESQKIDSESASVADSAPKKMSLIRPHTKNILINGCSAPEFEGVVFQNFKLSMETKNSCCLLKDKSVVEIKNFAYASDINQSVLIGQKYMKVEDFFLKPCRSSLINVYFVKTLGEMNYWSLQQVDCKLVRLPYKDGFVVSPLIHTA